MTPYEAIYNRYSVRRFDDRPLPDGLLMNLDKHIEEVDRLHSNISCKVKVVTDREEKVTGLFHVKAPYYLLIFVDKNKKQAKFEAGYVAEQLVLFLVARGIGTCYQGCARLPKSSIPNGMELAIAVSFGYSAGRVYRESTQVRRYPLSKTCIFKETPNEEFRTLLKAARMAPSAMNRQPCRLVVYSNKIYLFCKNKKKFDFVNSELDAGILFAHIAIAAEELWLDVVFSCEETISEKYSENLRYMITIKKC
jgi:hypothetical protein